MPILSDVIVTGDKNATRARVLVDTGATVSFIRRDLAEQLATIVPLATPMRFTLADGGSLVISESVSITLEMAGISIMDVFLVMPSGVEDIVLGEATMRKCGLKLDFEHGSIFAQLIQTSKQGFAKVLGVSVEKLTNLLSIQITDTKKPEPSPTLSRKETPMNELLMRLFARLGLQVSEALTDDDAINMIVSRCNGMYSLVATEPVLSMLGLTKEVTEPEVKGAILALQKPGNVIPAEQHNAVVAELAQLKRDQFFAQAKLDGKITPAEEPEMLEMAQHDFATFAAFIGKRGKQIPIGVKLPEKKDDAPARQGETAGAQLAFFASQIQTQKQCTFAVALREAQQQRPELARQHLDEMRA